MVLLLVLKHNIMAFVCLLILTMKRGYGLPQKPPLESQCKAQDSPEDLLLYSVFWKTYKQRHVICPKTLQKAHETTFRFQCNRTSTVKKIQNYRSISIKQVTSFLVKNEIKVMLVGDSITQQMWTSYECSLEAHCRDLEHPDSKQVLREYSTHLADLPDTCVRKKTLHSWESQDGWVNKALVNNITHVVINVGAWFSSNKIHVNASLTKLEQDIFILNCVKQHFQFGSKLYQHLVNLKNHDIAIIWRDTTPGGLCNCDTCRDQGHLQFPLFNAIARDFITSNELGKILPGVWDLALPHWREHVSTRDPLHWCLYVQNNIPSLLNTLLFRHIMGSSHPKLMKSNSRSKPKPRPLPQKGDAESKPQSTSTTTKSKTKIKSVWITKNQNNRKNVHRHRRHHEIPKQL